MKTSWTRKAKVDGAGFFVPKALEKLSLAHTFGALGGPGHWHTAENVDSLGPQAVVLTGGSFATYIPPTHTPGDIWQCLSPVSCLSLLKIANSIGEIGQGSC